MAIFRPNLNDPIPNNPFYYPETNSISSAAGPLIVGSGINIDYTTSVISASGGGGGGVSSVTGVAPIVVTGTTTPSVSIAAASTTASGAVQLYNNTNSTSTTLALTAAQGKNLQDQITALTTTSNINLAGTLNATTGFVASVTSIGAADGFTVGAVLPAASSTTVNDFVIVTTPGTITPPGGVATVATDGDWFLVSQTSPGVYAWEFLNVGFDAPAATTTVAGIACLSTNALAVAGTDATTALTPAAAACAYIPKACITAKGTLISGSAASTPTALAIGTAGQVLTVDLACASGLKWGSATGSVAAQPTTAGIVFGCTNAGVTAFGYDSGPGGAANVHVGCEAAKSSAGSNNVVVGNNAGRALSTGSSNTLVGKSAGQQVTSAIYNTLIGTAAGVNGPGSGNAMVGVNSGFSANTLHQDAVYIGNFAGCTYISCGRSVIVGSNSYNTGGIAFSSTIIGTGIQGSYGNCAVIGIGGGVIAKFSLSTGVGWDFVSDARVKHAVTALPVNAESFINALRPVTYCFLDKETKQPLEDKHCNVGFIAQEVEKTLEEHGLAEITSVVTKPQDEDDYYNLNDAGFTPLIVKALQELSVKVSALQEELNELKVKG